MQWFYSFIGKRNFAFDRLLLIKNNIDNTNNLTIKLKCNNKGKIIRKYMLVWFVQK